MNHDTMTLALNAAEQTSPKPMAGAEPLQVLEMLFEAKCAGLREALQPVPSKMPEDWQRAMEVQAANKLGFEPKPADLKVYLKMREEQTANEHVDWLDSLAEGAD